MTGDVTVSGELDPAALSALGDIAARSLGFPRELWEPYVELLGGAAFRAIRREGRIEGGLARIAAGHWFGGRAVPFDGIACVAIAPEARSAGRAERDEVLWRRLFRRRDAECHVYVVGPEGAPEGYVVFGQPASAERPNHYDVDVRDIAYTTGRAARRLLTLLGDRRSFAVRARWLGPARDPLLALLPEERARVARAESWLLRIIDVARALEGRGYPDGVSATLALEVRDALLPANEGRFLLAVEGGRGRVERGAGGGDLRLGVRALAPLYTGLFGARELAATGALEGTDAALLAAERIFAGPEPFLSDAF